MKCFDPSHVPVMCVDAWVSQRDPVFLGISSCVSARDVVTSCLQHDAGARVCGVQQLAR